VASERLWVIWEEFTSTELKFCVSSCDWFLRFIIFTIGHSLQPYDEIKRLLSNSKGREQLKKFRFKIILKSIEIIAFALVVSGFFVAADITDNFIFVVCGAVIGLAGIFSDFNELDLKEKGTG